MFALAHRQALTHTRLFSHIREGSPQRCMSSLIIETKDALRRLLRETAQPVAVVTSYYPFDGLNDIDADIHSHGQLLNERKNEKETGGQHYRRHRKKFHGATLSSFTSIALDPDPLVAFSLRIPSRMATSLKEQLAKERSRLQRQRHPHTHTSTTTNNSANAANLVINLLSSTQSSTAHHFARADLFPDPFRITPYELSEEGLPILNGALGAMSCELISCTPLHNLCDAGSNENVEDPKGVISELFISRVVRVENVGALFSDSGSDVSPLVYYRRKYGSVLPH